MCVCRPCSSLLQKGAAALVSFVGLPVRRVSLAVGLFGGALWLGVCAQAAESMPEKLPKIPVPPPDLMQEITEGFVLFDRDKDGLITVKELGQVMFAFGDEPEEEEVRKMISANDTSGDGAIDFPEFVRMMHQVPSQHDVRAAFVTFDRDNDEFIDQDELSIAMASIGENLNEDEILAMIEEVDDNGDRLVDYPEFVEIMTR